MQQQYQKHLMFSILLHIVLLTVLVVSFEFSSTMPVVTNADKVIEAMIIDTPPSPKKIIQKPIPESPAPKKELPEEPAKTIQTKVAPLPKKPDAIVIPDKKQKKLQEDLLQKEFLADMQKQQEKQQKKIKQKNLQAEFEKEMKALKAKAIKTQEVPRQMVQEQKRVASALSGQSKGVVDKYKALILQAISQHWLVPSGVDKKRVAELLIRVAPGGVVLDVQLTKSSGDDALDRSARAAVLKSSPLPVPADAESFEPFRQFLLKVKPENVLASDSWTG